MYKDKNGDVLFSIGENFLEKAYQIDEIEEDFPKNFKKINTCYLPDKERIEKVIEEDLRRYKRFIQISFGFMVILGALFVLSVFFNFSSPFPGLFFIGAAIQVVLLIYLMFMRHFMRGYKNTTYICECKVKPVFTDGELESLMLYYYGKEKQVYAPKGFYSDQKGYYLCEYMDGLYLMFYEKRGEE